MVDVTPPPAEPPAPAEPPEAGDPDELGEPDVIVLPWWQHPLNIATMLVAVALVAAMVGWLVGDSRSQPPAGDVDVGFLHDMREHHEQAVAMGFIYLDLDDTHPGLRNVARSIVLGQGIEIGRMIQMLRDVGAPEANEGDTSMVWMGMSAAAGSMPGMATREQLDELAASSGAAADRLFVDLMTAHHLGGIDMARYAAANAERDEVRAMADAMVTSQLREIAEMEHRLN